MYVLNKAHVELHGREPADAISLLVCTKTFRKDHFETKILLCVHDVCGCVKLLVELAHDSSSIQINIAIQHAFQSHFNSCPNFRFKMRYQDFSFLVMKCCLR